MFTDELVAALKLARYHDVVIVTHKQEEIGKDKDSKDDNSIPTEHVFIPTLDRNYGGIQWNDAHVKQSPLDIGIQRHLQTKRWMMPMLKDHHRNILYEKAIQSSLYDLYKQKQLQLTCEKDFHTCTALRALDIGTGTGILAMITHRHWTELQKQNNNDIPSLDIIGLEMSCAMARLAKQTTHLHITESLKNCLENRTATVTIEIIEGHSCSHDFNNQLKFDFCTCELLDSSLLGEGILPTMRDAWERHLYPHAFVIPQRARIYAQVVQGSSTIRSYRKPRALCNERISLTMGNDSDDSPGVSVPIHAEALLDETSPYTVCFLSQPIVALDFDFTSLAHIPTSLGRNIRNSFTASHTGIAHGILYWWECDLYDTVTYSTEMGKSPWQDHWKQCIFIFNDEYCLPVIQGQEYTLLSSHNDCQVFFTVQENDKGKSDHHDIAPYAKRPKRDLEYIEYSMPSFQYPMTSERSLQLNCQERLKILEASIEHALMTKGRDASFFDLSDFSLCSLIAAVCSGAKKVTSIESSSGSLPLYSATVSQLANRLPVSDAEYIVLNAHFESILLEHILGGPAQIACSEPYYEVLEGWHLQEALNYFYILRSMKLRGIVCNNAFCIPSSARLVGCAIELDEFFINSYSGIEKGVKNIRTILDFNHDVVDAHCNRFHEYDMNYPLWQFKHRKLTEPFEIARILYEGSVETMMIEGDGVWKSCTFGKVGKCAAFLYWIDYHLPVQQGFQIISTKDEYHFQSIRLLKTPVVVANHTTFFVQFNLSSDDDSDYNWSFRIE